MPLHRDDVLRGALELLDDVGLDAFTTRALTTRLGVRPGALYWHVRSKNDLLGALAVEVLKPVLAPGGRELTGSSSLADGDWPALLAEYAHRMRRALLGHRDGARLVATHVTISDATLVAAEEGLRRLVGAGFELDQAATVGDTVTSYVTGFVIQEQAQPTVGPIDLDESRYPTLRARARSGPPDRDVAFDQGLSLVVAGARSLLAPAEVSRRSAAPLRGPRGSTDR
jgi:TetR/AcrR family tetracycline transcriptional repressor